MAEIDIDDRRETDGYVAVYPRSTRHLAAAVIASGGTVWPPYQGPSALIVGHADNLGYMQGIPDGYPPTPVRNMYIRYQIGSPENAGGVPYYWQSGMNVVVVQKVNTPPLGNRAEAEGLLFFDLEGVPEGWTGIELVAQVQVTGNDDGLDLVAGYQDTYDTHTGGEANRVNPTPPPDYITVPYNESEPIMVLSEYSYGTQTPENSVIPATALSTLDSSPAEVVWPLADDGNWGTFRGIRFSLTGGDPSGFNSVFISCNFADEDTLPHLRFLYDGRTVDLAGEVTLHPLAVTGRLHIDHDRQPLIHTAKKLRGW